MAGRSRLHMEKLKASTPDHLTACSKTTPEIRRHLWLLQTPPGSQISFGDFYLRLVHQEQGKAN